MSLDNRYMVELNFAITEQQTSHRQLSWHLSFPCIGIWTILHYPGICTGTESSLLWMNNEASSPYTYIRRPGITVYPVSWCRWCTIRYTPIWQHPCPATIKDKNFYVPPFSIKIFHTQYFCVVFFFIFIFYCMYFEDNITSLPLPSLPPIPDPHFRRIHYTKGQLSLTTLGPTHFVLPSYCKPRLDIKP